MVLTVTIAVSIVIGAFMSRGHILFPTLFLEKASFPYLDALTTIASFTAMWLLVQKRIESWYYWIAVDVIGIGLYYVKGVRFKCDRKIFAVFITGEKPWLHYAFS